MVKTVFKISNLFTFKNYFVDKIHVFILNFFTFIFVQTKQSSFSLNDTNYFDKKYEKYFSRNTTELEKEEYINFVMHRIKEAKNLDRINNESTFNITYLFFFVFILYLFYLFYLFWINRVELLKDFFQSSLKKKKSRCYQVNLLKQLKLKQLKLKQLKLKQLKLKQLNTEDNLKKK